MKKAYYISIGFILSLNFSFAQTFTNGELDGPIGISTNPPSWQSVPDTDPNCQALGPVMATADVADATGPNLGGGIAGTQQSGTSFVTGLHASDNGSFLWHEGVMQTVNGFTVGDSYSICFYQAVVKQQNCLDPTGSWRVYMDNTLIGTSATTTSAAAFNDVNLQWELRTVTFTATAASHVIKFLPWDDDADLTNSAGSPNGGLRMGIDNIAFGSAPANPTITAVGPFCVSDPAITLSAVDPGGTWSGPGITNTSTGDWDPSVAGVGSHSIDYTVNSGCGGTVSDNITIVVTSSSSALWTNPGPVCETDAPINLDALVTGTSGGSWSGTGVTGSTFDPAGLSGNITVTYMVGTAPCDSTMAQDINVVAAASANWTPPTGLCSSAPLLDLNTLVTGTPGGTWSGTGVTGNNFDPSVGTQMITYTVGSGLCQDVSSQNITITSGADGSWTDPGPLCEADGPINLDLLITGTTGGNWSGTGVTGSTFDPNGLSGNILVTYSVGTAPCDSIVSQNINVIALADASWTPPTGLCATSAPIDLSTTITGTPGGSWSGTGISGTMFDPSVGTQSITYTVGSGTCQQVSTQTITIGNGGDPSWTTLSLCSSDAPINLDNQITGDTGGTWSGTGVSGNVFDPFFGTQSITYTVGGVGCQSNSTQTITVIDPQLALTATAVSCFGLSDGSANVTVTGGSGTQTYLWNPSGQTSQTATNLAAGTYQVTVTDGTCTVIDSIVINEPSEISDTLIAVSACQPNLGSASVVASGGAGGFTYLWSPTGQTTANAIQLDSAMHTVTITDGNGCIKEDSILVQTFPAPIVSTINDTLITYPNCIQLPASGAVSYEWSPVDDLDCADCPSPEVCPIYATTYCVTGTDANGCTNEDCVTVDVEIICGDVFVPSAFSPNNDGENDFECVYSDCFQSLTFTIYNRWGEKVFETNNMNICWDGTWKGKALNSAVFVYMLEGTLINGEQVLQKGNISLIR